MLFIVKTELTRNLDVKLIKFSIFWKAFFTFNELKNIFLEKIFFKYCFFT